MDSSGIAADGLEQRFEQRFGRPPDGLWAAPGRVNLIGEHTDYSGGFAMPIALDRTTRVAVGVRADDRLHLASSHESSTCEVTVGSLAPGSVEGWAAYPAGVVWALREAGHVSPGLDVLVESDVPVGAGLSSSAALECSMALAVSDLLGADLSREELVTLSQRAENDFAGVPTGSMDQSASLRCTQGHALFLDTRSGEVEQVPFDVRRHGLALLVIDTRAEHENADGQYAARRTTTEQAARTLGIASLRDASVEDLDRLEDEEVRRRVRHVVTENQRVLDAVALLREDRFGEVGALFTASHASLRDDYEVSCGELDAAVDAALSAGALGARMTGGGFGGSAIALVPQEDVRRCVDAVETAFADAGYPGPECFEVEPGPGARRLSESGGGGNAEAGAAG